MDYATFKTLQFLLFFGAAFAFCFWQLAALRRLRRERAVRLDQAPNQGSNRAASPRLDADHR